MIAFFISAHKLTTLNKHTHLNNLLHTQTNNDIINLSKRPILLIDLFNNPIK